VRVAGLMTLRGRHVSCVLAESSATLAPSSLLIFPVLPPSLLHNANKPRIIGPQPGPIMFAWDSDTPRLLTLDRLSNHHH
jgi:hypothetical protein